MHHADCQEKQMQSVTLSERNGQRVIILLKYKVSNDVSKQFCGDALSVMKKADQEHQLEACKTGWAARKNPLK